MTFWDRLKEKLDIPRIRKDITLLKERVVDLGNRIHTIKIFCDNISKRIDRIEEEIEQTFKEYNGNIHSIEEKFANLKLQVEGLSLLLSRKEVKEFLDTLTAE